MPVANNQYSRMAGVLAELKETWRQTIPKFEKDQELLVHKLPYCGLRNAPYAWKESLPFPSYWPYGMPRQVKSFRDRVIYLGYVPYQLAIAWNKFDEEDDQLGDLKTHVQASVQRYGQLPTVLIYEYFNGTAVELPQLYQAYDGAGLFSATDGDGNARLGASGGNIITGTGVTASGVLHDIAVAQQRFMQFIDPNAAKPIFDEDMVTYNNLEAIIPITMNEIFQKATNAEYIRVDPGSITSETNYLKGTFKYRISPFLTDTSDWYIVVRHPYYRPFLYRTPKDVETVIADINNSDHARETNENIIYTHIRNAIGVWFPGVIIKVNN